MTTVYSFDVFDTCISRVYAQPQDLFQALACAALGINGEDDPQNRVGDVVAARIAAERRARQSSEAEDIQLQDIYLELARNCPEGIEPKAMMSLELSMERASAVAIESTRARYNALRNAGERVILISDMYLPRDCILDMLRASDYDVEDIQLYLSGEIGLKKRTGTLFRHVLSREGIEPGELLHHGDHPVSDVSVPASMGITTVQIRRLPQSLEYENRLLQRHAPHQRLADWLRVNSRHYRILHPSPEGKLPPAQRVALSKIAGAADILCERRVARGDPLTSLHLLGYFVAAPLFLSFVTWLLDKAQKEGVRRLYFIARNGQIFMRIATKICASGAYDIECRYLYGSRAAWYPSSFERFDDAFIDLLLKKYPNLPLAQIFTDLGIPEDNARALAQAARTAVPRADVATDSDTIRAALVWLADSNHSDEVTAHFSDSWETMVDYLRGEGLFDDTPIGVVDIGWHLSSHNALYRIIQRVRPKGFTGFYFGVGRKREEVPRDAPYHAFYTDADSKRHSWMFKLGAMSLLEEVFAAANHPTTTSYYRDGDAVKPLMKAESFAADMRIASTVQDCMLEYTALAIEKDMLSDLGRASRETLKQFERVYKFPTRDEALAVATTPIYALTSHSVQQQRTLAHEIAAVELLTIVLRVLSGGRDMAPRWVWLPGSMAMSGTFVAVTGKLLSFLESTLLRLKG